MVLVDAVYINRSGGKILLEYLITSILNTNLEYEYYFLLDSRIENLENTTSIKYEYIIPNENERKKYYTLNFHKFDSFFCFANVPPPITIEKKPVTIYFHNTLIIDCINRNLNFYEILKFTAKKFYIIFKNRKNYKWVVQTEHIYNLVFKKLNINPNKILILPFFNISNYKNCNSLLEENYKNYLYVSDFSPQKNHIRLLKAWKNFSFINSNIKVTLHLTLPDTSPKHILKMIANLQNLGHNIINHKRCSIDEIRNLYKTCNYLIFPSLTESFGLPLIEAASSGCKIISSDLPYVHCVIKPSLTFNPNSIDDILEALCLSIDYKYIQTTTLNVKCNIDKLLKIIKYV